MKTEKLFQITHFYFNRDTGDLYIYKNDIQVDLVSGSQEEIFLPKGYYIVKSNFHGCSVEGQYITFREQVSTTSNSFEMTQIFYTEGEYFTYLNTISGAENGKVLIFRFL